MYARLRDALTEQESAKNANFHHFRTPTLSHLLALLLHPAADFPLPNTALIVIDSISTLLALAFPRSTEEARTGAAASSSMPALSKKQAETMQWTSGRRFTVMGELAAKLDRLAVTRNLSVVLVSQTNTRIRADTGALLYPATAGAAWDKHIPNRLVIYRDWVPEEPIGQRPVTDVRFARVIKVKGTVCEAAPITAFKIGKVGPIKRMFTQLTVQTRLIEINLGHHASTPALHLSVNVEHAHELPKAKRRHEEIADSESSDGDLLSDLNSDGEFP